MRDHARSLQVELSYVYETSKSATEKQTGRVATGFALGQSRIERYRLMLEVAFLSNRIFTSAHAL